MDFSACIRSLNRISGDADEYAIRLNGPIHRGYYAATAKSVASRVAQNAIELQIKDWGSINHIDGDESAGAWKTVAVVDPDFSACASARFVCCDPGMNLSLRWVDSTTGQKTADMKEHTVLIDLQRTSSPVDPTP